MMMTVTHHFDQPQVLISLMLEFVFDGLGCSIREEVKNRFFGVTKLFNTVK